MLLAKTKLNNLLNNELIDSYINHDEFVSVNNVLREDIKLPKNAVEYST